MTEPISPQGVAPAPRKGLRLPWRVDDDFVRDATDRVVCQGFNKHEEGFWGWKRNAQALVDAVNAVASSQAPQEPELQRLSLRDGDALRAIRDEMTEALGSGAFFNPEMFGSMLKRGDNPILRWRDELSAFIAGRTEP